MSANGSAPFRQAEQGATFAPLVRRLIGLVALVFAARAARAQEPQAIAKPAVVVFNGVSLGATFWVTFIGGIVMFRNMSRDAFGSIQSKLFPPYFILQAVCAALTAASHNVVFGKDRRAGLWAVAPAGILPLLNFGLIGPQTTKLLQARAAAVEGSAEWMALHKKFFAYHGMSSLCNLGAFLGQLTYACLLAQSIPRRTLMDVATEMAPTGVLRVAINMRNQLLVTGKTSCGDPEGLAPSLAANFAAQLGVGIRFVCYDTPAKLAEAAERDEWDVAMIGADPARAAFVDFTAPYCEIEATYVVPESSSFQTCGDVDCDGVRIASCAGAAYVLWLERNIRHAKLEKAEGYDATYELFRAQNFDALAGLRSKLTQDAEKLVGTRLLPGKFMAVEQAACTKKGRTAGFKALSAFIEKAKASKLVQHLMDKYGVASELVVAPPSGSTL